MKHQFFAIPIAAALTFSGSVSAVPIELITNGGFETGDFTGWVVTDLSGSAGTWSVDDADGFTPISGNSTVGPATGSFYAVTDQTFLGTHILEQAFTTPVGVSSLMLSFDMFMNDYSGEGPLDAGALDHNVPP